MTRQQIQRYLLIIAFIVLVVGIFVTAWLLFFQPLFRIVQPGNENINGGPGLLPNSNVRPANANVNGPVARGPNALPAPAEVANGDLTLARSISNKTTVAPVVSSDGRTIIFYSDLDDRFVRLDPETGNLTDVGSQKFPEVQNITWAPDGGRAVLEFPDDRKIIYDFSTQRQFNLPNEAQDFSFSGDSSRVAYEYIGGGPDESFLVTTQADGTGTKAIAKLGEKADSVQVAWSPSGEVVGLFRQGIDAEQQEVVFIGQNDENYKNLETEGRGFRGKWTPDGTKLLYTVYSEETNWNPELHLVYAQGDDIGRGNVNLGLQTSLDKCAFNRSGTHVYCAVPDLMERGSGLYPEFSSAVKDTLYTINLSNGSIQPLAQPVTEGLDRFTVGTLMLTPDESELYFTDQTTRKLLTIRLK